MNREHYLITYYGDGWIMVETDDDNAFDSLYEEGFERIVLYNVLPDGSFAYILGKRTSETNRFPLGPSTDKGTIGYILNEMEPGWMGSDQYLGAPVNSDGSRSLITPERLIEIINASVLDNRISSFFKVGEMCRPDPSILFSPRITRFSVPSSSGELPYINLDNAATTPPFAFVEEKLSDFIAGYGSVHRGAGYKSRYSTDIYEQTRRIIKQFVGAPESTYVLFTGNTTGAMNAAAHLFSFLEGKVAVSTIEHSSSWLPWIKAEGEKALGRHQVSEKHLEEIVPEIQRKGSEQVLQYGLNKKGEFDIGEIERLLQNNHVKVFVLTASSNLTGYLPKIKEIGQIVHKYGAYYLVDGCQYIQHHPMDMIDMGVDFLAASGHKFYAPYGGGFLIGPKDFFDKVLPYQIGGGNLPYITKEGEFLRYKNQRAHDPGTPNAVGAVTMAAAISVLENIGIKKVEEYEHSLTLRVYEQMADIPEIELLVKKEMLSTVIPFVVKKRDSREIASALGTQHGVGLRAGSFCVYHVVRDLLGIRNEKEIVEAVQHNDTSKIPAVIRASFSLCNTEKDVEAFISALRDVIRK